MGTIDPITLAIMAASAVEAKGAQSKAASSARRQQEIQNQQLKIQRDAEERKRKAALKKDLAASRARFGSSGVGSTGGSADAVLEGLTKKYNDNEVDLAAMDNLSWQSANESRNASLLSQDSAAFQSNLSLLKKVAPLIGTK
ncbi:MAG: hypothetical protein COB59_08665 [Rhodospirillaceae bacterium]|nr:MAG: hypothetical protein COB59_08665 [Rhodospirillaceae bacterium]